MQMIGAAQQRSDDRHMITEDIQRGEVCLQHRDTAPPRAVSRHMQTKATMFTKFLGGVQILIKAPPLSIFRVKIP